MKFSSKFLALKFPVFTISFSCSAFMASPVKQRVQAFEKHAMTPEKGKTASSSSNSKYVSAYYFLFNFVLTSFQF